jgi:hypothetical protein
MGQTLLNDDSSPRLTILRPIPVAAKSMREDVMVNITRPCKNCYIVALQADLQYADGRSANINQGAWLHHATLATLVSGSQQDWVCPNTSRSDYGPAYKFFASANERTAARLNSQHKYGLNFPDDEMFHMAVEIMNQSDKNETFYVSMVRPTKSANGMLTLLLMYEHVPEGTAGYKPATSVWLDVTDCGDSNTPAKEGSYELQSTPWTSSVEGIMLATAGHTHDGIIPVPAQTGS